ncbi:MAG: hypothetical protein ABIN58_04790 [candidate division WOR-3 bacterium]
MKVLSSSAVPLSVVKEALEKRAEAGEELGYEQANALEHAKEFSTLEPKKALALAGRLRKAVPQLNDETAVKLAEILPSTPALVRAIALYQKLDLKEEEIDLILKTIKG